MTAVLKMKVEELNATFVAHLQQEFAHSGLEIRVHEQPDTASFFTNEDFWHIIESFDWENKENNVILPAIQILETQSLAHIYRFNDMLSEKLWNLDTKNHAQVFLDDPDEEGYLSSDDFLYARCAVVANGRQYYENILQNPSKMPIDMTFEPLLNIAMKAYKSKTGKDFLAVPAFNYETYSNKLGWSK
jgi:hypothetical protein